MRKILAPLAATITSAIISLTYPVIADAQYIPFYRVIVKCSATNSGQSAVSEFRYSIQAPSMTEAMRQAAELALRRDFKPGFKAKRICTAYPDK